MVRIDEMAQAALDADALRLRSLAQDWLRETGRISDCRPPDSDDPSVRAVAAGLVELLAQRSGQAPPAWSGLIGAAPGPIYLLKSAQTMPRLRRLCEMESPLPLRRRNLMAPPTFLEFV